MLGSEQEQGPHCIDIPYKEKTLGVLSARSHGQRQAAQLCFLTGQVSGLVVTQIHWAAPHLSEQDGSPHFIQDSEEALD